MKYITFISSLFFLLQVSPAFARLGETEAQSTKRYGDPVAGENVGTILGLAQRFAQANLGVLTATDPQVQFTDASHHMGTTRMSSRPEQGVVDPNCREPT